MANKIEGFGRPAVDLRPGRSSINATTKGEARATTQQPGSGSEDAVQITDGASRLKRIEAGLAGLPDVDQARVQGVRQQLNSGTYKVDAQRVASKLLLFERKLSS